MEPKHPMESVMVVRILSLLCRLCFNYPLWHSRTRRYGKIGMLHLVCYILARAVTKATVAMAANMSYHILKLAVLCVWLMWPFIGKKHDFFEKWNSLWGAACQIRTIEFWYQFLVVDLPNLSRIESTIWRNKASSWTKSSWVYSLKVACYQSNPYTFSSPVLWHFRAFASG